MGTNYYIVREDEKIHIGKRSSMARPEGATVNPMSFSFAISIFSIKRKDKIVDEYGREYSYEEFFRDIVKKCVVERHKIGEEFS